LKPEERETVLEVLHREKFVDQAPAQVYASLLDDGKYLCSIRSMYRVLDDANEVKERRAQRRHPRYVTPRLVACAPNQVWSWDITKLRGPVRWVLYYLYVVLDIYSRYVVGWMLAHREDGALARQLIDESCRRERVESGQLTIHSDRGPAMTSQTLAQLCDKLGIAPSLSRPRVSNDNPYSESHFKTVKYQPEFPGRFGGFDDARSYCARLIPWYNTEHHHSSLALLTPEVVHHRRADKVLQARQRVLDGAYADHPERFVRGRPLVPRLPEHVWINAPTEEDKITQALQ
jgi:putative transposase